MGESAEELKIKMQSTESIVNHVSGTHNGFAGMENHVDSGGDRANGNANHISSSQKHEGSSSSSKHKEGSGSSSSSKHKEHHSSKHRDDHKSKHKEGHSSSSSKSKDGSSSSSSKQKDGSSSSPSKSSSLEKHKESSHSKDKHHSSSKHSNSEHKLHSKSSSSDKHKDGSSKTSSSADKPKEGVSKSSSSSLSVEKQKDGSVKTSSGDKHKEGSGKTSSSSADKHRDPSSKHSSDKHNSTKSSSSSSALDKHKDGTSSKSSTSIDKHKESSSKHLSDKHKDSSTKSSSTHEKHKEGSSKSASSSEKHKSSSSDKHRDGSSKSHSSSSDKHKDGSSKTSSEKVKESIKSPDKKDRPKDSDKHRDKSKDESRSKSHNKLTSPSKDAIKTEPVENNVDVKPKKEDDMQPFVKMENMECEDSAGDDVKKAPSSDEDEVPLSARMKKEVPPVKHQREESSDDEPLSARMEKVKKVKKEVKDEEEDFKPTKKRKLEDEDEDFKPTKKRKLEDEDEDFKPTKKRKHEDDDEFEPAVKKKKKKIKTKGTIDETKPQKGKKKNEEEQQVWKWWEEEKRDDGIKWTFLEHKGPVFAPLYERLPKNVKFYYDGQEVELSEAAEEVAGFYAKMLDHDYTTKDVFNTNFFRDWRKVMTKDEREVITDLKKCNFKEMHQFYLKQSEERKNRTKEQKQELKRQNEEVTKEYGFCIIDGHKEKIGNFRIEPPGLFRGRGDHPKQGRLKKRVEAEEVIINCSKDSKIPVAPEGHKWKEVRHDNSVTWLASWTENIQGATKYVMLNAASKLKGEKDWQKYEIARKLHKCVDKIRATYREDWKSKEMRVRQRAVALYFIDKLALRAGNEKEEGETADTVGCCSLRVEHIKLYSEKDGKECVVEFDFLGKDSIRYQNSVPVEKRVFKNLQLFIENKQPEDDLFDRLNTTLMNKHLHDLMEGLTAKVFRTYNASRTLQEQLDLLTNEEDAIPAKLLSYNRANRAVAILCNHQRSAPKTFAQSMENLINKVEEKRKQVKEAKKDIKDAKSDYKNHSTERNRALVEKKKKALKRLEEQLTKLEVQATDKEENKEIALGTSKLNYLDPRISVAWCKKWDIPIEKVYNKTQRDKFRWAIDMATDDFKF